MAAEAAAVAAITMINYRLPVDLAASWGRPASQPASELSVLERAKSSSQPPMRLERSSAGESWPLGCEPSGEMIARLAALCRYEISGPDWGSIRAC